MTGPTKAAAKAASKAPTKAPHKAADATPAGQPSNTPTDAEAAGVGTEGDAPTGTVTAVPEHDSSDPKDLVTEPAPPVTAVNAGDPDHRLETPVPPTADHQATVADPVNLVQQPYTTDPTQIQRPADSSQVVVKTDPTPPPQPNQNAAVNGLADNQPGVTRDAQNEARAAYLATGTKPVTDPNAGVGANGTPDKGLAYPGSDAADGTPGVEQPVGR